MAAQDHSGTLDMQRPRGGTLLPLHQDPLLEVPPQNNNHTADKSLFRDPFHDNIAEQSASCGSLDIPEFLFEGSFLLFFLLPLLVLIALYISMGLTISRCWIILNHQQSSRTTSQNVRSNYCSSRTSQAPKNTNPCSISWNTESRAGEGI